MKVLMMFLLLFSLPMKNIKKENISARSYIVMEQNSGEVLEGKDIYLQRSVASISKIMTAIIALESYKLYDIVTIGDEIDKTVGSAIYIKKGTQITIIDLVYGLLLRSGNDAALSIAYYLGNGSIENFVTKMNEKASELKMKNTIFNNPHGLDIDDDGNISCAYDMAILARYCNDNDLYRTICGTKKYHISNIGTWTNKNKLLHRYQYCTGGKTGFTSKARRTLVTTASKDNLDLIIVTLDCGNDFNTHQSLYEKYFNNYFYLVFVEKGINVIDEYKLDVSYKYGTLIKREDIKGLLIVYCLDIENLVLSFKVCYKTGIIDEFGPCYIKKIERITI